MDPHPIQKSKEVRHFFHNIGTTLCLLEESTQWANRSELYIGLFKEAVLKDTRKANSLLVFWDYCAEQRAAITNMKAKKLFRIQGQNSHMASFREQGDIFNIFQYGWYEWVYARDGPKTFPHMAEVLGRCLGLAKNEGNGMTQWVLKINGQVVPRRYLCRLRPDELSSDIEIEKQAAFDAQIKIGHGESFTVPAKKHTPNPQDPWYEEDCPRTIPEADTMDEKGTPLSPNSISEKITVFRPHLQTLV